MISFDVDNITVKKFDTKFEKKNCRMLFEEREVENLNTDTVKKENKSRYRSLRDVVWKNESWEE